MPILFVITAISRSYADIAVNSKKFFLKKDYYLFIGIFSASSEPISPHRRRCSPFAVVYYSFMGYCLAAAAISTRE